ncbi:hypothetical protein ASE75_08430 [Sphingomonas sp. Leaf17]|uniref:hypothetical protein n=1 Tax=Sphingomonas sp. Leaf17 TaxID=1735683 RepID=UPI0006F2BE25|nr:hypothetical protein [Sphingomonas sp. Leaf17]KQM65062.1 hypothetical protein ASE75_08430 [Sphingomonas sp. Leaf17]
MRFGVDYIDTRIDNQTSTLGSATAAFQSAFPQAFVRDDAGQLVTVDLRPVTIARERERKLRMTVNLSTQIGRAPPPSPTPPEAAATDPAAPPPKLPKPRPSINASVVTTVRLADRLTLAPGSPALDLLDGATLTGVGGRARWESEVDLRGSVGAANIGLYGRIQGPTRIRGDSPTSDLRFSGRVWLVPYASFDIARMVSRPWAWGLSMQLTIENVLNDRINVRDRNGATPNRFQAAYLDPLGRSVRIGVRKQF